MNGLVTGEMNPSKAWSLQNHSLRSPKTPRMRSPNLPAVRRPGSGSRPRARRALAPRGPGVAVGLRRGRPGPVREEVVDRVGRGRAVGPGGPDRLRRPRGDDQLD